MWGLCVVWCLGGCGAPGGEVVEAAPASHTPTAERVEVIDPRARAMPPGAANSGGFMTLKNVGPAATLVGARAGVAKAVELHTHVKEDGVMRMRQVQAIELPAGGEVTLQPGSFHVMFIGLNEPLVSGESFELTLEFGDGSTKVLTMPIKEIQAGHGPKHQ